MFNANLNIVRLIAIAADNIRINNQPEAQVQGEAV
jgi:hypothetical protein